MRGMCDAPSRALARRRRPSVPRPHSLTHEPQAGPSCIPSLMDPRWAYMSVFVFDVNTLGVVHVPHLCKPNGRGRETGVGAPRARGGAPRGRDERAGARADRTPPVSRTKTRIFYPPAQRAARATGSSAARPPGGHECASGHSVTHTSYISKRQVRSADLRSPALSYPSAHPCSAYICGWGLPTLRRQRPVCGPLGPHTHLRVGPGAYTGALTWAHLAADPDGALNGRLGQSSSSGPTRGVRALLGRRRRPPCPAVSLDRPRCMFFTERHPGRLSCGCNARRGAE